MRLISYQSGEDVRTAGKRGDGYFDLNTLDAQIPTSMNALLAGGSAMLSRVGAALESAAGEPLAAGSYKLLAPVPRPEKVICIGLNYADHAAESGAAVPSEPVVFSKFGTAVRADGDEIVLPRVSEKVDFEAELVAVIGTAGKNISESDALSHVAGYTCGHDVSARDWQKGRPGGQWLLGKSFDSFAPLGPELVTADEIKNPGDLAISLRLNGEVMQDSQTTQLIFSIPALVAHLSKIFTLLPGDLIFTGTPPGVGMARKPPVFLKAGDVVEVEIESIGVLKNPVVDEA